MHHVLRYPVSALACACLSFPVWAQQTVTTSTPTTSSDSASLDTVTVTGQSAATKTETPFLETPQSISTITQNEITEQGSRTVEEAARYTAGVFTNQYGATSTRYDALVLRGFTSGSIDTTYLDGLKLLNDEGTYSILQVDPYFLESMQVVKGPSSVLYGRASPGGLVALTSKRPLFRPYHQIQIGGGTQGYRSTGFDFSDQLGDSGRVAYRLVGKAMGSDSQFDRIQQERYTLAPSLTIDMTDDTSLTLMAYLQREPEGGYYGGVPADGALHDHAGRRISNSFYDGEPDYEEFNRRQTMVGYELTHRFNDVWSGRQNFRYVNAATDYGQVYFSQWLDDREFSRAYFGADEKLDAYTVDNQVQADFSTGALDHTVLMGLDYQHRQVKSDQSYGSFPALDAFDPSYGADGTISPYADVNRKLEQTGVYLQDQIALDRWRFTLGGRQDWVDIDNRDTLNGTHNTGDDTQFSGRAGVLYLFDNGVAPYLSYSESFNPNSNTDENGDLLEPTEGKQYEAGVKYQPPGTENQYSIALFHIEQENVANYIQDIQAYRAVGKVRSRGVELEARQQLTDQLRVQASYTYTDVEYEKSDIGYEGNTANAVPEQMASVWGHYDFTSGPLQGLDVGAGVRYTGESYVDEANTDKVPDYTLVDAAFHYDLGELGLSGVEARLNVNNLLDKDYVAACYSAARCYFGAERSAVATISYQF